ncbi:phosphoesterase, partial [Streptomyces sp. NRRL F-4489]|uniref:bifunctional phosphatase PAP2/diacylglycerol kinase family protein n=1 Tax=Streptomyces sp. NRRL F-4489 TaxID=1609095 RepID=UPI00074AE54D
DTVPAIRRVRRQPFTSSFPSGHAASAAAFATGVAFEKPWWGLALAPVAASVAFSRVYTGVHYPGDVLAGAALGVGAAYAIRGMAPTRSQLAPPARPRAEAPALPGGRGLVVVANPGSGQRSGPLPDRTAEVRRVLPDAKVMVCGAPDGPSLDEGLAEAAELAREQGGALGVLGGDGTVNAAAAVAVRHGLPLAVLPGGTLNHFAYDLGIESYADAARAIGSGEAVAVDLARFRSGPPPTRSASGPDLPLPASGPDPNGHYFLNTFSIGVYPELVRIRERWAHRIGPWPAGVLAAWHVLRTCEPLSVEINGERRTVWMLFAGNCQYRGLGAAPVRRHDLADGVLDVRVVHGGRLARTRLLLAALLGTPRRSPVLTEARLPRLRLSGLPQGTPLAYDGEVAPASSNLTLEKHPEALTVYRHLPT